MVKKKSNVELGIMDDSIFSDENLKKELEKALKTPSPTYFFNLPLASRGREWDSTQAEKRVREWATSGDSIDFEKYKKAFLWWDNQKLENLTSYKLGIGDIIDGELKAIPRAIFAVAGVLQGARGGVEISQEDQDLVKIVVKKYYEIMRDEFKDPSITPPWEVEKVKKEMFIEFIEKQEEKRLVYGESVTETAKITEEKKEQSKQLAPPKKEVKKE